MAGRANNKLLLRRLGLWIFAAALTYITSFGPATYLANRFPLAGDPVGSAVEMIYFPLIMACDAFPPLAMTLDWYCGLFQ